MRIPARILAGQVGCTNPTPAGGVYATGAATLLLRAGVHPRIAQQLLQLASSKATTEIYSHVTAAQERQAAEVLEAALAG